jgi:hypothetical protein
VPSLSDCPWLGTCVGKLNYRSFFLFLTFLNGLDWFLQAMCLWHLVLVSREYEAAHPSSSGSEAFHDALKSKAVVSFILLVFGFIFMFFTTSLYVFHIYLVVRGVTTNEELKHTFPYSSPHSDGWVRNFVNMICQVPPRSRLKRAYKLNARTPLDDNAVAIEMAGGAAALAAASARQQHLPRRANGEPSRSTSSDSRSSASGGGGAGGRGSGNAGIEPDRFAFHPLASSHRFHGSEQDSSSGLSAAMSAAASAHNWLSNKTEPGANLTIRVVDATEMERREKRFKALRQEKLGDVPQPPQPAQRKPAAAPLPTAASSPRGNINLQGFGVAGGSGLYVHSNTDGVLPSSGQTPLAPMSSSAMQAYSPAVTAGSGGGAHPGANGIAPHVVGMARYSNAVHPGVGIGGPLGGVRELSHSSRSGGSAHFQHHRKPSHSGGSPRSRSRSHSRSRTPSRSRSHSPVAAVRSLDDEQPLHVDDDVAAPERRDTNVVAESTIGAAPAVAADAVSIPVAPAEAAAPVAATAPAEPAVATTVAAAEDDDDDSDESPVHFHVARPAIVDASIVPNAAASLPADADASPVP